MTDTAAIVPIDLHQQYARIRQDLDRRVAAVFEHGRFVLGPEVAAFEEEIAHFAGARHAVGVSSGRDALVIALWAAGIGHGDVVFTSAFTYAATGGAIVSVGARPVFVDVDPETFLIDPDALARAIDREAGAAPDVRKAIMPVDLFGWPADYGRINAIAEAAGLPVIVDAAQSLGARRNGRPVGSLSHVTATSFFPTKPLGAAGDGGCLFTDDDDLAERFRSIRVHGHAPGDDRQVRNGMTGRLDTVQAAVLSAKLEIFPDELSARERVASAYDSTLADVVSVPGRPDGCVSAWAQYSILSDRRDAILAALQEAAIPARVYYRYPLHLHPAFATCGQKPGDLPVCEDLANRILSLPMHPYLTEQQINRVTEVVRQAVRSD